MVNIKEFGGNELAPAGAVKEDLACSGSSPLNKSDRVISGVVFSSRAAGTRAPDPGLKLQAPSFKRQALKASSGKRQASSSKLQAPSRKRQAPRS